MKFQENDIQLLLDTGIIPKGVPKAQLELFIRVCQKKQLNPLTKQIYLIKDKKNTSNYIIITSIDGYRSIANRTGLYAGNDDAIFNDDLSEYKIRKQFELEKSDKFCHPITATVTVYKLVGGVRCPFTSTASWESYFPEGTQSEIWTKNPFLMLAKVAEAMSHRKAFPDETGDIYIEEEIGNIEKGIKKGFKVETELKKQSPELIDEDKIKLHCDDYTILIRDGIKNKTIIKEINNHLQSLRKIHLSGNFTESVLNDSKEKLKSWKERLKQENENN